MNLKERELSQFIDFLGSKGKMKLPYSKVLLIDEYLEHPLNNLRKEIKDEKGYSEDEVDKIIEKCINTKLRIEEFHTTGIMSCPICNKKFIKLNADGYSWKPDCDCFKTKIRVSVG